MAKNTKATSVLRLLNDGYSIADILDRMAVSYSYVWKLKKAMAHIEAEEEEAEIESADDIQMGGDHYKCLDIEPWDVFDTWPIEQRIGAYRANCTKYVMRLDHKDTPLLNAQKLAHYAQKLVEVLEER
jgi:hypothetical protein